MKVSNLRTERWRYCHHFPATYPPPLIGMEQVKSAGTTIKDKLETASLEAGMDRPGEASDAALVRPTMPCMYVQTS